MDASTTDKSEVVHTVSATDGGDGGDLIFTMHDCPGPFEMAPSKKYMCIRFPKDCRLTTFSLLEDMSQLYGFRHF